MERRARWNWMRWECGCMDGGSEMARLLSSLEERICWMRDRVDMRGWGRLLSSGGSTTKQGQKTKTEAGSGAFKLTISLANRRPRDAPQEAQDQRGDPRGQAAGCRQGQGREWFSQYSVFHRCCISQRYILTIFIPTTLFISSSHSHHSFHDAKTKTIQVFFG